MILDTHSTSNQNWERAYRAILITIKQWRGFSKNCFFLPLFFNLWFLANICLKMDRKINLFIFIKNACKCIESTQNWINCRMTLLWGFFKKYVLSFDRLRSNGKKRKKSHFLTFFGVIFRKTKKSNPRRSILNFCWNFFSARKPSISCIESF